MATPPTAATKPATASTSSAAKKPTPEKAPRPPQRKLFHFFVRITDSNGQVIHGANLHVAQIMTDPRKVIEYLDTPEYANSGLTRIKHEIVANKRGEESDGATSVG